MMNAAGMAAQPAGAFSSSPFSIYSGFICLMLHTSFYFEPPPPDWIKRHTTNALRYSCTYWSAPLLTTPRIL
ncbi:hypothetical protein BCV70DRAFT_17380 [Testicularia cyperi]|uniref:Uncharacterized protein n=1 Tax=Testicularia cyperi TaxID=1882483 RepID=A0A317XYS3_9BASI|nr:hypothetical protein BCV70DRAFT_17380 [Testicularia cyperi]